MSASGGGSAGYASEDDSACSTPFVSAPSSPARDRDPPSFSPARDPSFSAAAWFYSTPASPARRSSADEYAYGREIGFDFGFDLSGCPPSPAAAAWAMAAADELFDNGQIRPLRLASLPPPLDGDVPPPPSEPAAPQAGAAVGERGRVQSRSARRRYRSLSPFRARWLSPPPPPAPAAKPAAAVGEAKAAQSSAPRSSSSSSTASSASSAASSSRSYYRRWRFLKDILHRSKSSDGGGEHPPPPKRSPSPSPFPAPAAAASQGRGRARRSAHARLYEPRRAEAAEEMRRRTFLPAYRHGLPLLGCLGLGSRGYVAMHGLVAAGKARP